MKEQEQKQTWPKRLLWFLALWLAGVLALGTISYGLRFFFNTFYS